MTNVTMGTQTFTKIDSNKRQLRAALTIYRTDAQSNAYAAVIDVTAADPAETAKH
jgi:hypothetical protein